MSKVLLYRMFIILAAVSCGKKGGSGDVSISVKPTSINAPYTQSSERFDIIADGEWSLKAVSPDGAEVSWARPNYKNGNGNVNVTVRVSANQYSNERTCSLVVTSKTGKTAQLSLTQDGNPESSQAGNQVQIRVGQYNLRGDWCADKDQWAWENRKEKLVRSIKDCDFDIFGVNEFGLKTQAYFKEELGDIYNIIVFSPYSQDGVGDRACGILHKKSFTLKEFHYFWMADPPEEIHFASNNYSAPPACLGIFAHKETGIEFFFMATHTNSGVPLEYYSDWEKKYNPSGNAAFMVGDFNMRPDDAMMPVILKNWTDAYEAAPIKEGLYTTYNAFNTSRNMKVHVSRIDYVFFRNATPVRYMNFDTRVYDGYYSSDHMPIYCDMIIRSASSE